MTPFKTLAISLALALPVTAFGADGAITESAADRWEADHTLIFDASEIELDDFLWLARPVIVFAETDRNPEFQRQVQLLESRIGELAERDVVVITDADPEADTALRRKLRPRGFMLAIIGKDGQVKLRKPSPWDVREITRSIDKMPLRQQEVRDRRSALAE
jgi:hypothetical protein